MLDQDPIKDAAAIMFLHKLSQQPKDGAVMKGRVRPISLHYRCPICKKPFEEYARIGYICKEHLTTPRKFYVDMWDSKAKKRVTYYTDLEGRVFDSYTVAMSFLEKLNDSIKANKGKFEPKSFKPEEAKKYQLRTVWDDYKATPELADGYVRGLKKVEKYVFGFFQEDRDIRTITMADMKAYLEFIITKVPRIDTAKSYCRYLISCLNGYSHITQIHHVMPKLKKHQEILSVAQKEEVFIPPVTDSLKIISHMPEEKFRLLFLFNVCHQTRPADTRALQAGDFNFTDNSVRIQRSAQEKRVKKGTKTGKKYTIPIHKDVLEDMKALCIKHNPDDYIFGKVVAGKSLPYGYQTLYNVWDAARKLAGLRHIKMYAGIKHAGASKIANSSGDRFGTSKLMGKKGDAKSTLIYTAGQDLEKMRELQAHLVIPDGIVHQD